MRVYYQKEHQRITNNTDSGQWLIVTDATGDRWVKCEELRFGGETRPALRGVRLQYWLFGSLGNENFYVCKPLSFYKSQREIQKVNPLYAFKVATAYFREQGMIPVFEDANCKLIKL